MTSRAVTVALALFKPAAALFGWLRYAQKFMVLGLVLLVPLGYVAKAYVDLQHSQISSSVRERQGVELMAPLIVLTADVVEARHHAVTRGGDEGAGLADDLAVVDDIDRRVGAELGTAGDWRSARALVLAAAHTNGTAADRYRAYNAVTDRLLALIVRVGDESNLTLDPNLDSYYLMDTLQFRLPVLLDTAGRSADRAALPATDEAGGDTDVFIELGLDNGVLASTRKVLARTVGTVSTTTTSPDVRAVIRSQFDRLDAASVLLGDALTTAVKSRQVSAIGTDAADAVRAAATSFAASAAEALDELLLMRIDGYATRARQVEIGTGLAGLLAIYLFVGFYLSVTSPIWKIIGALKAVARGDLARRVTVDTHDELSFVATALNETFSRTEVVTERLAVQATHDKLTSLPNRALVIDRLELALSRTQRSRRLMAAFFIDLDRFKLINDSLGHEAGDQVLCVIAGRLTDMVRAGDTVARLAGDEFVVIGEELAGANMAVLVAERIVTALSRPIMITCGTGEREVSVGASVGIAFADGGSKLAPGDLLRDADVAMYRAKQRGRGRVEIFDDALRIAVERRSETLHDLRRGIECGQIRVYYQPIVETAFERIVGFEALVRWEHPTRGLLGPVEFVEVAEESGLIVPLGAVVLAEACRQMAEWRANRPGCDQLHIAINVSGAQFSHPSFVPTISSVLAETGLQPDALWLEITETSIMENAESTGDTLEAIRALGVHLAIDDFGTGYSSLAYLRRFPVEVLKIDRSFVDGLGRDREDEAIVAMIVSLARTLDLLIIAEGVETRTQLEQLHRLGCTTVQGHHFGEAAPPERAWDSVARRQRARAVLTGP